MTREEIIRNLKYTMKKHENDRVDTFGTNISLMCKDILDYLEQEPCDDAVSRYAVKKWVCNTCPDNAECQRDCDVIKGIDALPSVTQKYGKWIRIDKDKCKCDQCEVISLIAMYPNGDANYCPNCGAKMQESEEV